MKAIGLLVVAFALLALGTWLTQVLWNYTMPFIFHLPRIGLWQAGALWLLARALWYTPDKS